MATVSLSAMLLTVVTAGSAAATVIAKCVGSPAALSIASGGLTNYSLDANGSLWGWGANSFGQIGNGARTDVTLPLNASGFKSLQAVSASGYWAMVLRQDGTVWAWGDDSVGQLGDGRSGTDVMSVVPSQVPGLANVVATTAGAYDAFALKSDGTVWAWGYNDEGQLGDGTKTMRAVPTQIPALTGVTAIAASREFTLALKSDGSVWAWGRQTYGALGSNVTLGANQLTPLQVPGISGATAVAAGFDHAMARKSDGTVWSWGDDGFGQLGDGAFNSTSTPLQVSGLTGVTAISAEAWGSLAVKSDGTAWSWGSNFSGGLGNPTAEYYQSTPVQVSTISGVSALSANGWGNSAAAVTSDGAVWDWGPNQNGQIGKGTTDPNNTSPQRSPYRVSVTQALPAAPTNLAAVAGNALAYLTWTPPTAAITQYVITPYLNGVAQAQVAAPAGSSTATLSGMVTGGNYTFTVAAQNCLGTGTATAQSNRIIPTGVQVGGADQHVESASLTDRMGVQVNTYNGNLSVSERDLAIKGTGLDLVLERTYNNRAMTTSIFGRNWTVSGGTGVRLSILGDGSVFFHGPGGSQVGFAKNPDGTFTAPGGIDSTLTRDGSGTYTLRVHASGETWRFTSAGVASSHADRNANTISYTYGGPGGAVSAITDTQGRTTILTYNAANLVSTLTDPAGRVSQYGYDGSQRLTSYTDPAGGIARFAYDGAHNLTQITTPAGRVVGLAYDAVGRVTSMAHPLQAGNPTTTYTYNATSTVVTDANSHVTTYTYDPVGRTTKVVDGLANQASASYTSNSNVATFTSGSGAPSATFGYDDVNNPTSAQAQPGAHTTMGYTDPNHPYSPTTVTDPQNNTSTLAYDAAGNVVRRTDALASQNQVLTPRNANGTMASSTDPDGHLTRYGYDAQGNLTSVTPPAPLGPTAIVYDVLSRPTRVTDGAGQATTYAYDQLDRLTTISYQDGRSVTHGYDVDGNLTSQTDAAVGAGPLTTMVYDGLGRLTRRTTPDAISVSYTYDGVGNLLTLTDPGGTTSYTYNVINLPTRVTDPAGKVITLGYDANYNRTSVGYPNGVTMYSTYDAANRLVRVNSVNISGSTLSSSSYDYTPSGPTRGSARAITMVGAPSTYATGTIPGPPIVTVTANAVTLASPAGLTAGAVELAQISVTGTATISSSPAGWTLIRQDSTGTSDSDLRQALYVHVANGSEPAVNSWILSQAADAAGALTAWTGVDTSAPVKTSAGKVAVAATTSWTAPSVAYQNGELNLAFYGGKLPGAGAALGVPTGYAKSYDTQTKPITVGLDTRTVGVIAGSTGDQTITGPSSLWVGQQVLLRPRYDSALRQTTTADGTVTYDALNRLTQTVGGSNYVNTSTHNYTYDGAGNRLTQSVGTQAVTYSSNDANQLSTASKVITQVGYPITGGATNTPIAPTFTLTMPSGVLAADQLLLSLVASQGDTVSVSGYTVVATAAGITSVGAKTVLLRRTATGTSADYPIIIPSDGATVAATLTAYRGVDPTDPIHYQSTGTATASTTLTIPGWTYSTSGEHLVVFQGAAGTSTQAFWSPPAGATQQASANQTARSAGIADMGLGATTGLTSTGPLTSRLVSYGGAPANLAGVAVALRPAKASFTHDGNGSLTAHDGGALAYDAAHRTTSITPAGGTATTFTYRGAGQTERATMTPAARVKTACATISGCLTSTWNVGASARFVNTSLGVSAEIDDGVGTYFVRDPRGGLLAERTPTSGTYYYLFDGHGSVTGLTDASGYVGASYQYDAFGQLTWMDATAVGVNNPWRYVGAYQDGTGLYKMGARYYDPTLGRFTQQDPVFNPLDPRSWNRYAYVGNDPVNYTDPSGMASCGWTHPWDCARDALDYGWCVGKHMLPLNPDDLIALWTAQQASSFVGSSLNPAVYRIYADAAEYGGEKVAERLAERLAVGGSKVAGRIFLIVGTVVAVVSCT